MHQSVLSLTPCFSAEHVRVSREESLEGGFLATGSWKLFYQMDENKCIKCVSASKYTLHPQLALSAAGHRALYALEVDRCGS